MLYNLTNLFASEQKEEAVTIPYDTDVVSNGYESYPILEKSDVQLTMQNQTKGEVVIHGMCKVTIEVPCARCLKPVSLEMDLQIEEYVKESDMTDPENADEHPYMDGYQLDVDALVGNEIMINWPVKVLCKEDCKGICKVCGKDLNEGECGCDTFVPDPRMAVLKDIFNV